MTSINDDNDHILDVVLEEVPFMGWSQRTLRASLQKCDMQPDLVDSLFPDGVDSAITRYVDRIDEDMLKILDEESFEALSIRGKIAALLQERFKIMAKRKTLAVDTISYLLMPHHVVIANKLLFRTSGIIWRAIGDTSTDYNYYSKRLLLSGVYSSSLLYWMNDDSEDHEDTYAFIDRRIADVMTLGKCKAKYMSMDVAKNIPFIRLLGDKFSSSV